MIPGGWLNRHWIQLAYQLADSVSGFTYSFVGSCIILFLINLVPGLHLRASEQDEVMGIDDAEVGEFAYDYVEVSRDVVHGIEEPAGDEEEANSGTGSASGIMREKGPGFESHGHH